MRNLNNTELSGRTLRVDFAENERGSELGTKWDNQVCFISFYLLDDLNFLWDNLNQVQKINFTISTLAQSPNNLNQFKQIKSNRMSV